MERSFTLLKAKRIDLMQVHNLVDWETHLATLRHWRHDDRIRYWASRITPRAPMTSWKP